MDKWRPGPTGWGVAVYGGAVLNSYNIDLRSTTTVLYVQRLSVQVRLSSRRATMPRAGA